MPSLSAVRTYVNGKLDDLWNLADARQQTYAASRGRYWQGRITKRIDLLPNTLTADASTKEYAALPDDQEYDQDGNPIHPEVVGIAGSHTLGWKGALPQLPATLAAAFQADEFLSPAGIGWTLTCWIRFEGTIFTRSRTRHEDGSITTEPWATA